MRDAEELIFFDEMLLEDHLVILLTHPATEFGLHAALRT
jgi:hypothetical protein